MDTQELILEYIKKVDASLCDLKGDMERKFEGVHQTIQDLKNDIGRRFERIEDRVDSLYESRNEIKLKVTWQYIWSNVALSTGMGVFVALMIRVVAGL